MPSAFPGALDNVPANKTDATATATDHADHHNRLADAVNALQAYAKTLIGLPTIATATPVAASGATFVTLASGFDPVPLQNQDGTYYRQTLAGGRTYRLDVALLCDAGEANWRLISTNIGVYSSATPASGSLVKTSPYSRVQTHSSLAINGQVSAHPRMSVAVPAGSTYYAFAQASAENGTARWYRDPSGVHTTFEAMTWSVP